MTEYTLGGRLVTRDMYDQVQALKRQGAKVALLLPEGMESGCTNCGGDGYLRIGVVVGGPYETARSEISRPAGDDAGLQARHIATAHYDEDGPEGKKWVKRNIFSFPCPVCGSRKVTVNMSPEAEGDGRLGRTASIDELLKGVR